MALFRSLHKVKKGHTLKCIHPKCSPFQFRNQLEPNETNIIIPILCSSYMFISQAYIFPKEDAHNCTNV